MEWDIGQRVLVHHVRTLGDQKGTVLTITNVNQLGIGFDNDVGGHDLGSLCEDGHGWYITASEKRIEPLNDIVYDSSWDELWE